MFSAETDCETQAPTSLNKMEKEVTKFPMANAWGDHATTDNASRPASSHDHEIGTTALVLRAGQEVVVAGHREVFRYREVYACSCSVRRWNWG